MSIRRDYHRALHDSTAGTDSAPFIVFMLRMIGAALTASAPQVTPQVADLLRALRGEMTRGGLQSALGLADRKSFRERYLQPALADGLIEMTMPAKPHSRLQHYRLTDTGRQWLELNAER